MQTRISQSLSRAESAVGTDALRSQRRQRGRQSKRRMQLGFLPPSQLAERPDLKRVIQRRL